MKNSCLFLCVVCFCGIASAQWDSLFDFDQDGVISLGDFAIFASHWGERDLMEPEGMEWIYINDPGVSGHEGFVGEMSKYETTNAQYCHYLNAALASGDVYVTTDYVIGSSGLNTGVDFVDQPYYWLTAEGYDYDGVVGGGAPRIIYNGSSFTVESGFENHPVTRVSWYRANAFCYYYLYRLPTEWEWQAAADYDGSYTYGCGTTIDQTLANCLGSVHPYGSTPVGAFGTYGYGFADMSGNVMEWTSTLWDPAYTFRILRGGNWTNLYLNCSVADWHIIFEHNTGYGAGFRACR